MMSDTTVPEPRGSDRRLSGTAEPLLRVRKLNVGYGDVQVLWDVGLDVYEGEIVALVGANGAGKTTLLSTLSGLLTPMSGEITVGGNQIAGLPAHEIVAAGIVQVPEGRRLFGALTVLENLRMGAFLREDRSKINADISHMLDLFPRLKDRLHMLAGKLSGGEQQMVAIARGLMARPKLLMVDELSLGLAPVIVENLFEILSDVNKQGTTVLIVEQDVQIALEQANYAYVLETGQVVLQDTGADLLGNPKIQQAFLGLVATSDE
jgi:ABC-type branched-subunit amino acid transport system ATPase component